MMTTKMTVTFVAALFLLPWGATLPEAAFAQPQSGGAASAARQANVSVVVSGIRNTKGQVIVWLWSGPEGFAQDNSKAFKVLSIDASRAVDGKVTAEWAVPAGDYAATTLHDENSNQKMDMNFLGIPSEGFGVSNNIMVMGPPAFKDTKFAVTDSGASVPIKLRYF